MHASWRRQRWSVRPVRIGIVGVAALLLGSSPAAAASSDVIDSFAIDYRVDTSGVMHVKETIVYRFGSSGRHGIERALVTREKYDDQQDQVYGIKNVAVDSPSGAPDEFTTNDVSADHGRSRKRVIRIGDSDETVWTTTATYVIEYDVTGALRSSGNYDELYWDATGFDWDASINQVAMTATVPGGVADIRCYQGVVGSTDECGTRQVHARVALVAAQRPRPALSGDPAGHGAIGGNRRPDRLERPQRAGAGSVLAPQDPGCRGRGAARCPGGLGGDRGDAGRSRGPRSHHRETVSLIPFGAIAVLGSIPILLAIAFAVFQLFRETGGATRTAAGRAVCDQVEGFRTYLATAEADQLKFEEGEDIFSKYLPWAIVFDLADRWERICADLVSMGRLSDEPPSWYEVSGRPAVFQSSSFTSSVSTATGSITSGGSSDTGTGGGSSFSSSGGYSGGGGGGGGGGSW